VNRKIYFHDGPITWTSVVMRPNATVGFFYRFNQRLKLVNYTSLNYIDIPVWHGNCMG